MMFFEKYNNTYFDMPLSPCQYGASNRDNTAPGYESVLGSIWCDKNDLEIHSYHCSGVMMSAMASETPASRLFAQRLLRQIKESTKTPRHWRLLGNPQVTGGFPTQWPVTQKNVSIWWRHRVQCSCHLPWCYNGFTTIWPFQHLCT